MFCKLTKKVISMNRINLLYWASSTFPWLNIFQVVLVLTEVMARLGTSLGLDWRFVWDFELFSSLFEFSGFGSI